MADYDPMRDVALVLAAVMQTAGGQPRVVADPLLRLAARLGFTHGTDPSEVEGALRGVTERRVRREAAREILHLDEVDRGLSRNVGPYGDMRTSLRKLARGEQLPDVRDLRGGEAVRGGES